MTDDDKIRVFEKEILDKAYLKKEFINYSDEIVIPYLLQIYGVTVRHREELLKKGHTETSINTYLTNLLHGIGHCVRWIKGEVPPKFNSLSDFSVALRLASEFANWGIGYHMIAQEFVAWSRGVKGVELNEIQKTITFTLPDAFDYSQIFGLQHRYMGQMISALDDYPQDQIHAEFLQWIEEIKPISPPIANSIHWSKAKTSRVYPTLLAKINQVILPELPDSTDMGGYTLRELRIFYTLFYLEFSFIIWIENLFDQERGVDHSYGSNPLDLTKSEFLQLARKVTDLSNVSLERIIADLTFDHSNFHSSLSIQPFVQSNSGNYYILPNLFVLVEPSRMMAGAFSKGKKKVYDGLISQIEKEMLRRLVDGIHSSGRISVSSKQIKFNKKTISPDIIIVDPKTKSVLVIDYKHFISPGTASEVVYKMKEINKGINQVTNYVEFLKCVDRLDEINIKGFTVFGMLLTHKPLPVPIPLNNVVRISDSISFLDIVNNQREISLEELYNFFKPIHFSADQFEPTDHSIMIEDWTVVRKMFKRI